mmetsp:Transcript_4530/g.6784  ORF Transcript_4530/g.6784 Transcript_4530/m.6784 type:complete len:520 (+) Transcript_4530:117-1676(+)
MPLALPPCCSCQILSNKYSIKCKHGVAQTSRHLPFATLDGYNHKQQHCQQHQDGYRQVSGVDPDGLFHYSHVQKPGERKADQDVKDVASNRTRHRHVTLPLACDNDTGEQVGGAGPGSQHGEPHHHHGDPRRVPYDARPVHHVVREHPDPADGEEESQGGVFPPVIHAHVGQSDEERQDQRQGHCPHQHGAPTRTQWRTELHRLRCFPFQFGLLLLDPEQHRTLVPGHELFLLDVPIVVGVHVLEGRLQLPLVHLLVQGLQDAPELMHLNPLVGVAVEEVEDLLGVVLDAQLAGYVPVLELVELHHAVLVGVQLRHARSHVRFAGLCIADILEETANFVSVNRPIAIFIQSVKGFLQTTGYAANDSNPGSGEDALALRQQVEDAGTEGGGSQEEVVAELAGSGAPQVPLGPSPNLLAGPAAAHKLDLLQQTTLGRRGAGRGTIVGLLRLRRPASSSISTCIGAHSSWKSRVLMVLVKVLGAFTDGWRQVAVAQVCLLPLHGVLFVFPLPQLQVILWDRI